MLAKLRAYLPSSFGKPTETPTPQPSPRLADRVADVRSDVILDLPAPRPSGPDIDDLTARAEAAVDDLSDKYETWLYADLQRLYTALTALKDDPRSRERHTAFHGVAHDLSGIGEMYGAPEIARLATSICKLAQLPEVAGKMQLLSVHVDACRAAHRDLGSDTPNETTLAVCAALEAQVSKLAEVAVEPDINMAFS